MCLAIQRILLRVRNSEESLNVVGARLNVQTITAGRLNSPRLRGVTNQHRLTDHHSNLINRKIVTTVTAKVANHKTGQSKDDCTSTAGSATAFTRNSERAKQRGT